MWMACERHCTKGIRRISPSAEDIDDTNNTENVSVWKVVRSRVLRIPIGLVLFKRSLDVGLTFGRNAPISWPFVIGFPLTIAPFIVLFLLILKTLGKLGEDFEWNLLEGKTNPNHTRDHRNTAANIYRIRGSFSRVDG